MAFIVMMIPYYGLFKVCFLIFCYHPNTMGATQVWTCTQTKEAPHPNSHTPSARSYPLQVYKKALEPYVVPLIIRKKVE